jgi:hypothetical protein
MADKDKVSIFQYTTSTTDGKKTKVKSERQKPGQAWIKGTGKNKNFWVKPTSPDGNSAWDDNKGWTTAASQATAYDIPLAIIKSDAELDALFNEAWAAQKRGEEFTQENFITKLKATNWYKSKSEAQRKFYTLSKDPAQAEEFASQVRANKATVQDVAGLLGASLTDTQAQEVALTNLQNGFNEAELRNFLSGYISFSGQTDEEKIGSLFGAAGDAEDDIRRWATQNNVTLSEDWVLRQARGITAGDFTVDRSKDYVTNIAKQQYSAWADKIDAFNSVEDLAAGYRQIVASEFGEDVDKIGLKNNFIDSAMKATDDQGRPITNQSLLKTVRRSDEWSNVSKNKDKIYGLAEDILTKFGMR